MTLEKLVDRRGRPLPDKILAELVKIVTRVISHPDADVEAVVERARTIGSRAADGEIDDLARYATRALFAVAKNPRQRIKEEATFQFAPDVMESLAGCAREGSVSAIEASILVGELLGRLAPLDREVYVRTEDGWEHREIARDLGISEAMSWFRLRRAKKRLASWARAER